MRTFVVIGVLAFIAAPAIAQQESTYVGVVTDSMCGRDHAAMKVSPDEKCVRECARDGKTYHYALATSGGVYKLSDQAAPAALAGRKVKVVGTLFPKTNILKVTSITASR